MAPSGPKSSVADVEQFLEETRQAVAAVLTQWGERVRSERPGQISDAIAYSLEGTGKRLRPALVVAAYRAFGGTGEVAELASAVEVIHTYSLIHDDLPCMDDDAMRRGRPATHAAFDVPTAVEAGFRMIPLSARVLAAGAKRLGLTDETLGRLAGELFRAAGGSGMIGGQVLDLEAEGKRLSGEDVTRIHRLKTGSLIEASVVVGTLAAGAAAGLEAARAYGQEVGLAFQIVDDVLDATGTSAELGKTAGKDAAHAKPNYASVLGVEKARAEAGERVARGVARLQTAECESGLLSGLAHFVVERRT